VFKWNFSSQRMDGSEGENMYFKIASIFIAKILFTCRNILGLGWNQGLGPFCEKCAHILQDSTTLRSAHAQQFLNDITACRLPIKLASLLKPWSLPNCTTVFFKGHSQENTC
jgi:hypothetical protein